MGNKDDKIYGIIFYKEQLGKTKTLYLEKKQWNKHGNNLWKHKHIGKDALHYFFQYKGKGPDDRLMQKKLKEVHLSIIDSWAMEFHDMTYCDCWKPIEVQKAIMKPVESPRTIKYMQNKTLSCKILEAGRMFWESIATQLPCSSILPSAPALDHYWGWDMFSRGTSVLTQDSNSQVNR